VSEESPVSFREVQRFGQAWVWVLVIMVSGVAWYGAYQQLILKKPFGDNPAPDSLMWVILVVFGIGFPLFFYSLRLVTEVRANGLYYRFYPLHRRFHKLSFSNIAVCEAVTYRPIRDYGGWGIRFGHRGKAFNVRGNRGVELVLNDQSRILIGSQKPEQLAMALSASLPRLA
jgi:hypothetical protein